MTLLSALEILKLPVVQGMPTRNISLLCGFSPLHLKTFLAAELRRQFPASGIEITTGLYGDLHGNLERLESVPGSDTCVVVEWSDLDQRLGIRSLARWRPTDIADIVESARRQSERLVR